jgi:hypothetical protein
MKYNVFKGTIPKADPRLLPEAYGQLAMNLKTDMGTLRPIKGPSFVNTPSKAGIKRTIYLYNSLHWLHWLEDVDVVKGPIAGDTSGRLYWTGEGAPKVSDATLITAGGGTGYPTNSRTLGIPAPLNMPSVAKSGASSDPTQEESRSYVYTYVSAWGEEGPPSAPSAIIAVEPTQTVTVSGMSAAPTGSYNITHKRIYRTTTGTTGTDYRFVATVTINTSSYVDSRPTSIVGQSEQLPSTFWDPPPSNMHSLILHPSGFMVGISGKDICFSETYLPHAWPEGYRVPIEDQPIGLGVFGNSVLVVTESTPFVITGTNPEFMTKERIEINQACVSKRGIVDMGGATAYPSPDGLILIGPGIAKNLTEDLYTREQWQALHPENIISAFHDGCYYGFVGGEGIFIDFKGSDVKTIGVGVFNGPTFYGNEDWEGSTDWENDNPSPTAAYSDPITDTLYLMVGSDIVSWDTGEALSLYWKSRIESLPVPTTAPTVAQVIADNYPVTFRLYADKVLRHVQTVTSWEPFRVTGGYRAKDFEIELISRFTVKFAACVSSMESLR